MSTKGVGQQAAGRSVSTVIGVVLMVAIVTLLAAVVGVVAFGFGEKKPRPAPSFGSTHTYDKQIAGHGEYLNVTHESGDTIFTDNLTMTVTGAVVREVGTDDKVAAAEFTAPDLIASHADTRLTAGESFTIDERDFVRAASGDPIEPGTGNNYYVDLRSAHVLVRWFPPNQDKSAIVFEWAGPDY